MLVFTERQTTYAIKESWKDYSRTEREILTEKSVLDCIADYLDYDEDTIYCVKKLNEEEKEEFSRIDFKNQSENLNIKFFTLTRKVRQLTIIENLVNTGKDISYTENGKEKTRKEVIVKNRLVVIEY